ncbi:dihydrolipoyl dehydrogenase family protein [Pseudodesulfovibrio sp.]|uniref:dihydrolipoyl dehydrogenase family protein n=1 Tax=unclassified Pseudodesulfovibrio TaxID=2661612 RepID=UPI003B00AEF8
MTYDVVVIGAGPGGFDAAVECAGYGMKTALVEKEDLGGTCLNRGCIPTKFWLGATSVLEELSSQSRLKVASGEVTVDFAALQTRIQKHLAGTRKAMATQLKQAGIELFTGEGHMADGKVVVNGADGETVLEYKNLVVATGSKPTFFPGLEPDGDCVLDSTMFLTQETMPSSLIVVGAGFIGLEMAQAAHRMGAKVTVVDAMDRVAPLEDPEVSKALASTFKRWKWDIRLSERVAGCTTVNGKAELTLDNREKITADKILVAVGRGPVTANIGLRKAGLELEFNKVVVNEYLEAAPHIYAIGDANGHIQLAHAASHQAHYVAARIAGHMEAPYEPGPVPSVLYGAPEVMRVGLTESEAFLHDFETTATSKSMLAANPMAQAHAATQGFVKVIWSAGKVVGITAVGHDVSRLTTGATLIVKDGWSEEDIHKIMFAHPSLDEALLAALKSERTTVS